MDVKIEIERDITIPYSYSSVHQLLRDVPDTIRLFPKLNKLTELSSGTYLWELSPIGSKFANIAHEVSFASRFDVDLDKGLVQWKPVQGHGNAKIEGHWQLTARGQQTHMSLKVRGELFEVPVPVVFRLVAPPFIQGVFAALIERYFQKLEKVLDMPEQKRNLAVSG